MPSNPVNAVNAFSTRLLQQWRASHPENNVVYSPLSIASAFLLVYKGAVGETKEELEDVFSFGLSGVTDALQEKCGKIIEDVTVSLANRVYVEKTLNLCEEYVRSIGQESIQMADFQQASEQAIGEINDWVSQKTQGHIPSVLAPGALDCETALVAVNALYFKGQWLKQFNPRYTVDEVFHGVRGDERVPFMKLHGERIPYKDMPELDGVAFSLQYQGGRYSMCIFLPNRPDGWKAAENQLAGHLNSILLEGWQTKRVSPLKMPKWEMRATLSGLEGMLDRLGLHRSFDKDLADFSDIAKSPQPLFISNVAHLAKIKVDEEGTVAAAATHLAVFGCSMPPPPIIINVDRPFLYFIVDQSDGTILFHGTQTSILETQTI